MPVFLSDSPLAKRPVTFAKPAPTGEDWWRAMTALYGATDEATRLAGNTFSRQAAVTDAYQNRIRAIHAATGVELENPMLAQPDLPPSMDADTLAARALAGDDQEAAAARNWDSQTAALAEKFPAHAALIRGATRGAGTMVGDAGALARAAEARVSEAAADPALGTAGRITALLAGGMRGAFRDPVQVATIFAGAPEYTAGRTVLARIGQAILREGLLNAGVETVLQPEIQAWRGEAGLDAGFGEAAQQVGFAGLIGGLIGGSAGSVREIWRALRLPGDGEESASRLAGGTGSPEDIDRVAGATGVRLDDDERSVAGAAAAQGELDRAAAAGAPGGVSPEESTRLATDAVRQAEDPDAAPVAVGPVPKPPRDPAEDVILRERPLNEARDGGLRRTVGDVQVTFPDSLHAALYDFGTSLERGVTPPLAEARRLKAAFDGFVVVDPAMGVRFDNLRHLGELALDYARTIGDDVARQVRGALKAHDVMADGEARGAWFRRLVERLQAEGPAAATTSRIGDRPVTARQFDPRELGTDAAAYQYKDGGDAAGVTDRLKTVARWDPVASGKVIVHERRDGKLYVADGHQRLGLAKRLFAEGDASVRLDGYLLREADGWTVADVRALAAKKNLQEGSGTAMDAARILRDRPDILDDALPTTAPMLRRAQALARLSPDAWGLTINGLVPENFAALVGEMVADPGRHAAVLRDLARFEPQTEREARLLVQEIQAAGVIHERQEDMFGAFDVTRSLMGERVKVLDRAMVDLKADKKLFGVLATNADVIEAAGNALDRSANAGRAASADFVASVLERLARSRGPISDALTRHAEAVAGGKPAAAEARAFLNEIRDLVERDGLERSCATATPLTRASNHRRSRTPAPNRPRPSLPVRGPARTRRQAMPQPQGRRCGIRYRTE